MSEKISKFGFGSKENIESAKEKGKIDSYDVLFLENGEIAWIDKNGNTIFNQPKTQQDIIINEDTTIEAGKTMDDIIQIIFNNSSNIEEATEEEILSLFTDF